MMQELLALTIKAALAMAFVRLSFPLLVYWALKDNPPTFKKWTSTLILLVAIYAGSYFVIGVTFGRQLAHIILAPTVQE